MDVSLFRVFEKLKAGFEIFESALLKSRHAQNWDLVCGDTGN